jgi:N,N-dimethylformamidase beta subunit-like, C-terminal
VSGDRAADRAEIVRERFERQLREQLLDLVDDALVAEHAAKPLGPHSDDLARVLTHFRRAPVEGKYIVVAVERDRVWQVGRMSRRDPAHPVALEPETYGSYHEALHAIFLRRLEELRAPDGRVGRASPIQAGQRAAIHAYTSRFSFEAGDRVPVHVSCEHVSEYTAQLVRLRHGYDGADGPGFREEELASAANRTYAGRYHDPRTGSYVVVSDPDRRLERLTSWTIELLIQPTTPEKALQGLLGPWAEDTAAGYALALLDRRLTLLLGDGSGTRETLVLDVPLERGCWYRVRAALDIDGSEASLALEPVYAAVDTSLSEHASRARGGDERFETRVRPAPSGAPFLLGALARSAAGELQPVAHYNGKLEAPCVLPAAVLDGDPPEAAVARWDFGRSARADGLLLDAVLDTSGNELHGECVNMPTRGVTGHNWSGGEPSFRHAPDQYGAIHFHDDDLEDARWPEAFGAELPPGLASGVYAMRLRGGGAEEYVPFAVRPSRTAEKRQLALLLPTGSYLAYANDRLPFDADGAELLAGHTPIASADDLELQRHYDFGRSCYELHSDGSGVVYSSRRHPILNMRPRYRGWFIAESLWQFPADLCIVDWLEAQGLEFDVITDEDLHREGVELLAPYRTVITGSHPEYISRSELDALEAFVGNGGRMLYLGGNGFYWIVSYHPDKPWVMEVRRSEAGSRPHTAPAGEYYLSTSAELGAMWRSKGRPPQRLVGVGFTAEGFDRSTYYTRLPDSFDPRAAFILEGTGEDERIGDFGLVGGGAAGAELDRYDLSLGTPPGALLLASSAPLSDNYRHVSEEILETPPGTGGSEDFEVRADMVYFCLAGGGAVFSVGSIAWTGSLSHNGYDNNVSRITGNVVRRFLDPAPLPW